MPLSKGGAAGWRMQLLSGGFHCLESRGGTNLWKVGDKRFAMCNFFTKPLVVVLSTNCHEKRMLWGKEKAIPPNTGFPGLKSPFPFLLQKKREERHWATRMPPLVEKGGIKQKSPFRSYGVSGTVPETVPLLEPGSRALSSQPSSPAQPRRARKA